MGKAQEDFEKYTSLAEELGLEESEADSFISSAMKRLGHRPKLTWEDGESSNERGGSDFFQSITGGKRQETRSTRPARKGGSDWQYGRSA